MDYFEWFPNRLGQLRIQKGVSARDMSLSLGQCECYIIQIENGKAFPPMVVFSRICQFFGVEPKDFFNPQLLAPSEVEQLVTTLGRLKHHQIKHLLQLAIDLLED